MSVRPHASSATGRTPPQCEGDITKLSPQEQQKLQAAYPGQSARLVFTAAYSVQR